jgi:hypothetical protein
MADPSKLGGLDKHDPHSVDRLMQHMGKEMGEDVGQDMDAMMDEASDTGEAIADTDSD